MITTWSREGISGFSRASWLTSYFLSDSYHFFVVVAQVEAVIHPQFLADLLSPEQHRDPLALMEELEQEEGLSLAQVNLRGSGYQNMLLANPTLSWMV